MRRLIFLLLIVSTPVAAQTRDADVEAVRQCIDKIQPTSCKEWVSVQAVRQIDRRVDQGTATVIGEIDLKVLKGFSGDSNVSLECTGMAWKLEPEKVLGNRGMMGAYFLVGQKLQVHKNFEFKKFDSGWRCTTSGEMGMIPVFETFYLNNSPTAITCKVKMTGQLEVLNLLSYEGGCKDGLAEGQGTLTYLSEGHQGTIKGEFRDGEMNGNGRVTHDYGFTEGEFRNNKLWNATVHSTTKSGAPFFEEWRNGVKVSK